MKITNFTFFRAGKKIFREEKKENGTVLTGYFRWGGFVLYFLRYKGKNRIFLVIQH